MTVDRYCNHQYNSDAFSPSRKTLHQKNASTHRKLFKTAKRICKNVLFWINYIVLGTLAPDSLPLCNMAPVTLNGLYTIILRCMKVWHILYESKLEAAMFTRPYSSLFSGDVYIDITEWNNFYTSSTLLFYARYACITSAEGQDYTLGLRSLLPKFIFRLTELSKCKQVLNKQACSCTACRESELFFFCAKRVKPKTFGWN